MTKLLFRALVAIVTAPALVAQAVLDVPASYPQISDALSVAQPGDVVLVASGAYLPFTANVGVRIVATGPVNISASGPMHTWHYTTFAPPAGQTLYVSGLTFQSSGTTQPHIVQATGGQVVLEGCTFHGGHPAKVNHALRSAGADLILRGCTIDPMHSGLLVDGGTAVVTDCRFLPTDNGYGIPAPGPIGVGVNNAKVAFHFSEIRGANAYPAPPGNGVPAMVVNGISQVTASDCSITGGDAWTGAPVPAVVNNSAAPVQHQRTAVLGGFGNVWVGFTMLRQRGPSFVGTNALTTLLGGLSPASGLVAGSPYAIACSSEPSRLVVVLLSWDLTLPQTVPLAQQAVRFDPATVSFAFGGTTNSQGIYISPTSTIPPGTPGRSLWLHPVMLDGTTFEIGPPLGGVVR